MDEFSQATGRTYRLFDYYGSPDADRVIVMMGSGVGAAQEAVDFLQGRGEKIGLLVVRLYRPFDVSSFLTALPETVQRIAVLDRTKEPGAIGEPLYQDVVTALHHLRFEKSTSKKALAHVFGGRYGLASKEFTPDMVVAIFEELASKNPKHGFTVGIIDDVTHRSLPIVSTVPVHRPDEVQALFYGLGSDGTVGATKNSVKIIGDNTDLYAQGYFVYDSKKSGAMTVSHLRIGRNPIRSTYLIQQANFVACHQFSFLERIDILERIAPQGTLLLNCPYGPAAVWEQLPIEIQSVCIDKNLKLYTVDAEAVAKSVGMPGRINIVMQVCFFALADVLPREEAIGHIKKAIEQTYGKRGASIIEKNFAAVDQSLQGLHSVEIPRSPWGLEKSKRFRSIRIRISFNASPRQFWLGLVIACRSARCPSTVLSRQIQRDSKSGASPRRFLFGYRISASNAVCVPWSVPMRPFA